MDGWELSEHFAPTLLQSESLVTYRLARFRNPVFFEVWDFLRGGGTTRRAVASATPSRLKADPGSMMSRMLCGMVQGSTG